MNKNKNESNNWTKDLEECKNYIIENFSPGDPLISTFNNKINYPSEKMEKFQIKDKTLLSIFNYLALNNFVDVHEIKNTTNKSLTSDMSIGKIKSQNKSSSMENITKTYSSGFKLYVDNSQKNTLFFAREFNNSETKDFYLGLKERIEKELKLEVIMLEDDVVAGNIHSRIKNEIRFCKYFIADLTYTKTEKSLNLINGNVMFEIGMAKGYNKPCLLIMSSSVYPFENKNFNVSRLPFDISSHTTVKYKYGSKEDVESIVNCIKSGLI